VQRKSYREEGGGVFLQGLGATLTRAFIVNSVIFASYEICLKLLDAG